MKSDWLLKEWGFDGGFSTGHPFVVFVNEKARLTVRLSFERDGALDSVCFAGRSLDGAGLPHVTRLASEGRQRVTDWVTAYGAGRPAEVRKLEADGQALRHRLGDLAASVETTPPWELEDIAENFAPPTRPGRASHSDTFLAVQAQHYVTRGVEGGEKVTAIARSLGIPESTFSTQLRSARKRNLLSGCPSRGAVEGELTAEAKRLLAAVAEIPRGGH